MGKKKRPLEGVVEFGFDLFESFVDFVGEFFGGVGGFAFEVVEAIAELLARPGSFVGGEGDADGYTREET
jgi:hypothetical protein